jgi:hypothetical protein
MQIVCSTLFEQQLKTILEIMVEKDIQATKSFKIYLDTIILNMPTKAKKYKKSLYFDDENIRDIDHQGFLIPFFIDEENDTYLLLGIVEK